MNVIYVRGLLCLFVATLYIPTCSFGQQRPAADRPASTYDQLITAPAHSQYGMLGVHQVGDKIYLEIPDTLLNRDILAVNRLARGWAGDKPFDPFLNFIGYSGDLTAESLFRFAKEKDGTILLHPMDYTVRTQHQSGVMALPNADMPAILHSFPVLCRNPTDRASLVDGSDFLSGDNTVMTFSKTLRGKYGVSTMQGEHSGITDIQVTDTHAVTGSIKTYTYKNGEAIRMALRSTWFLLPEVPYEIRRPDHRVGYYTQPFTDYSSPYAPQQSLRMVKRWRMEPRPEDRDAYFQGELVEPARPLVIYIDPAMPGEWVPYMIQGINDWQPALEQAGFRNAIRGERIPLDEKDRMVGDARYSMICYKPSPVGNATAELVTDPRSGEILNVHIAWHHGMLKMVRQWLLAQGVTEGKKQGQVYMDAELTGRMIRSIIAHEVGHCLGLLHNFGASSTVPVERLRDRDWLAANPISPSIMDYVRVNYVAQPEDRVRIEDLFPRVGEYDKWAIEWGYGHHPGYATGVNAGLFPEKKQSSPSLWFGHQDRVNDPRCQAEDLGDDPVMAACYGIRNLKRGALYGAEPIRDDEEASWVVQAMLSQYSHYLRHAVIAVNGGHGAGRSALSFLQSEFFRYPDWLVSCGGGTAKIDVAGRLGDLQQELLPQLLTHLTLKNDTLLLLEMQKMVFAEPEADGRSVPYSLRLQRTYVDTLNRLTADDTSVGRNALPYEAGLMIRMLKNVLFGQLADLRSRYAAGVAEEHLESLMHGLEPNKTDNL